MKEELIQFHKSNPLLCGDADTGFKAGYEAGKTVTQKQRSDAIGYVWESYVFHNKTFLPNELVDVVLKALNIETR